MSKILRNDSSPAVDIILKSSGVTVSPGAGNKYTIDASEYTLWANSDIIAEITPHINIGDIVVNNGLVDLNAADGIRYLLYPDRVNVQLGTTDIVKVAKTLNFEGDVNVLQSASGEATITIGESGTAIGKVLEFEFSGSGTIVNKWMNVGHPSVNSFDVPFVSEWAGKIIGISFSNKNDDSDIDIEVYINGTLEYTWEVREKRTAWNVLGSGFFTAAQGDRISIFARDVSGGTDPRDVSGEILALVNTMPDGTGGTQFGV